MSFLNSVIFDRVSSMKKGLSFSAMPFFCCFYFCFLFADSLFFYVFPDQPFYISRFVFLLFKSLNYVHLGFFHYPNNYRLCVFSVVLVLCGIFCSLFVLFLYLLFCFCYCRTPLCCFLLPFWNCCVIINAKRRQVRFAFIFAFSSDYL